MPTATATRRGTRGGEVLATGVEGTSVEFTKFDETTMRLYWWCGDNFDFDFRALTDLFRKLERPRKSGRRQIELTEVTKRQGFASLSGYYAQLTPSGTQLRVTTAGGNRMASFNYKALKNTIKKVRED